MTASRPAIGLMFKQVNDHIIFFSISTFSLKKKLKKVSYFVIDIGCAVTNPCDLSKSRNLALQGTSKNPFFLSCDVLFFTFIQLKTFFLSGYFIYSQNGGDIRIICLPLPSKGLGAASF